MCKNYNSSKRSLVTTLVVLAICLVIVTGSTFSLFTSSTGVNIAITAGNVKMTAKIDNAFKLYSKDVEQDKTLENGVKVFENGGTAELTNKNQTLTVRNITPGDKVELKINLKNESNVDVAYRVTWSVEGKLAEVLTGTVDGNPFTAGTSEWTKWSIPATETEKTKTITLAVAFPMDIKKIDGKEINYNDYQGKTANISFAVEAVQANATAEYDPTAYVNTEAGLQAAINAGATKLILNEDVTLTKSLVIPAPKATATTYSLRNAAAPIVIDLNGNTITGNIHKSVGAIVKNNGNVVIKNGTISSLANNGGSALANNGVAVLQNVTLNGAPNADGSWPSYTVNNTGNLTATNTKFTSFHGAVASYGDGAIVTLNNCEIDMKGIPGFTSHGIYTYNNGAVVVNGGTYVNHAADQAASGASVINGAVTINGGTFTGRIENYSGTPVIAGGTFSVKPNAKFLLADVKAVETANGWIVISENYNYVADGVLVSTDGNTYSISNAAGYAWVDAQTDAFFSGKTIVLTADIDFGGATINSIRFWNPESKVEFDGQNHTLSNFVINTSTAGLFSGVLNVKNLVVDNANITGTYVGAIAGNMYGNIDNCTVKNSTIASTYWQCGGLVGQYNSGNVNGCTVENCTISGGSAVGGLIGILNEATGVRKVENCTVNNCEIKMPFSFGGEYNEFFGAGVGLINISNSKVYFTDNTLTGNIVKGEASNALYGVDSGNIIFIDGIQLVNKPIVVAPAPLEEDFLFPAGTNAVIYKDMVMTDDAQIVHSDNAVLGLSNVVATLDHDVIVRKSSGAIVISDCEFTLAEGAKLITVGEGGDGHQVFLINVTVNGVLLTQENAGQYLEGITWFNAVSEWPNA